MKYFKVKFDKKNNTDESFWYLEIDLAKHRVLREVEDRLNGKIRKAPTEEDNYGVFTDNLDVVVKGQAVKYKETIVIDPNDSDTKEISREEFESMWLKDVSQF